MITLIKFINTTINQSDIIHTEAYSINIIRDEYLKRIQLQSPNLNILYFFIIFILNAWVVSKGNFIGENMQYIFSFENIELYKKQLEFRDILPKENKKIESSNKIELLVAIVTVLVPIIWQVLSYYLFE